MKIQTAFRLDEELVEKLKKEAKKEQRSLNNYVEFLLSQFVNKQPNEDTLKALQEALDTDDLEKIEDVDAFLKSI
jgi:hypothetical protein